MSADSEDQPARSSRRPQRKRSIISSYEQLARDEERQLQQALKASMVDAPDKYIISESESEPESEPEPEKPAKRGRGRPRGTSKRQKSVTKSSPSPSPSPAPSPKSATSSNPAPESPKSTSKKKKSIIRQKSASGDPVRAQRKFASVNSNGKRGGLVRQRSGGPKVETQKPTIASPAKEENPEKAKTEDFIDYLCLRKNVRAKAEWKNFSGEEDDGLIIAESEDSSADDAGEDFSIFEFDDAPTEPTKHTNKPKLDTTTMTVKNKSKSKKPESTKEFTKDTKKRRITQNYYNANLKCTDHTDNSALPTAPVFRPTGEEFKNFHAYLEKITPHLLTSGICKIIPPVTWRPPPVLQEDMRFGVSYQEVHRLCHRFGPSTQVLAQIKAHLANQGVEWKTPPQIGSVVVDLAQFSWLMRKNGGLQVVIDKYKWQKIGDALGLPSVAERNVQLEEIYCKYLLGYDLLSDAEKEKLASDDQDDSHSVEISGKQMTLSALRRHDSHARKTRFAPDGVASASSLEHDYWMLLTSAEQHFVAPNGSESTRTHGSGFPANKPRHIAESDWNLTNLPSLPDGVMGFLPGVASVTQPRLEFCSLYTSSGWHVEPHFLPQISYNHFSHPRIWYATPASDSRKILSVLHDIAPRLIPGNHLLDRNSVMVPPAEISSRGINVCRAVQKPGEFIITAPKAYLSNLSLGLNVNEVVNFATEEWLHHCSDSVSLYQSWSLKPLLNIAQIIIDVIEHHDSLNESSLRLAEPYLTSLLNEELTARKTCTLPTGTLAEKEELYCTTCQTLCHLSCVRVEKGKEEKKKRDKKNSTIFCLKHARHLKTGTLECRISEEKLKSLLSVLEKRLYPKRSIVHPVQSLPRSVRRTHLTPSPVTVVRRSQSPPGSPPAPSSPNSPTCPPSPAEEECTRGLTLVIPPQPISCAPPTSPVYSPKPIRSLARPVPLKPQPIKSPGIPSLAVRPQQNYLHSLLPQQPPTSALWERWYPGMQQQFP